MQRDIKQIWSLSHSPETVWEFLTSPELLGQWLMENDFKPIVGHKFMFSTKPKVKFGFDGQIYCEVLEVVPYKKLSYTWKGGSNGRITLDSVVTWTLIETAKGTNLHLEHAGFKGIQNYFAYVFMGIGWASKIRKRFTDLLNTGKLKEHSRKK